MQIAAGKTFKKGSFPDKYINMDERLHTYYSYSLTEDSERSRYEELMEKRFSRSELAKVLYSYNRNAGAGEETLKQINKIEDRNSVVVVGGQQAGLLTGPLYTVNKIISILTEAERLENKLQVPVVPVFWIAGEDHDIDEVNHTYFHHMDSVQKVRVPERNDLKQSVSERRIDSEEAEKILKDAFIFMKESRFTGNLLESLMRDLNHAVTYSDWFANIIHRLFSGSGIVLLDAHDPGVREIERPYFKEMITKNNDVQEAFFKQGAAFKEDGYGEPVELDDRNAHLFFHEGEQRFLMNRQDGVFSEKDGLRTWTEEELLQEFDEGRLKLSNNVVTRPVMQDLLLPVHTFIGGLGEIAYWGVLKDVFKCFGRNMPLVQPRHHITLISRKSEKTLNRYNLLPEDVLVNGTEEELNNVIGSFSDGIEDEVFEDAERQAREMMVIMREKLSPLGKNMSSVNSRFETRFLRELETYKKAVIRQIQSENSSHITRLKALEAELRPDQKWQERHLNIYPFLNQYGPDLVGRVLEAVKKSEFSQCHDNHIFVYL